MTERTGLVGHTGFVGGNLMRQRRFDAVYNSSTIADIEGERFDVLVCAGAPATMWAANADPEGDASNLDSLLDALRSAHIGTLVVISTVAVFDDLGAGYTESSARYETRKAYGRNRRGLETAAVESFGDVRIIRLPALFGPGLKKNFIFDLMNPAPSFINPSKFQETESAMRPGERAALKEAYVFDPALAMWRHRRDALAGTDVAAAVLAALERVGFLARNFTNSQSRYQFYNVERLSGDIDCAIKAGISVLNICSEPTSAGEIHAALVGERFENNGPARIDEDVRTDHAAAFGARGPYLFDRGEVLADLRAFFERARAS